MKKSFQVCAIVAILFYADTARSGILDNASDGRRAKKSEDVSFIVLGDVHYCDASFYDLDKMQASKPGDYQQITKTYAPVTKNNWSDLVGALKNRIAQSDPSVRCVVQLGDISEGIANVEGMSNRMAENMMNVLESAKLGVPWLLVKGNHDVTGFDVCKQEARDAFRTYYTPFIKKQIGSDQVEEANYVYQMGDVLIVALDAYNRSIDQIAFVREALENSTAKYKFVCMHEPAVPATERCWHYLKSRPEERSEFLKVLAQNKAIFLCAHLHRYSVLRRNTPWGPIVQVMVTSTTNMRRTSKPTYQFGLDRYGASLVDWKPDWNSKTAEQRRTMLADEANYVTYYKMNNLAGYAVISIDAKKERVLLRYYPAFGDEAFDEIDLTELYSQKYE